MIKNKKQKRPGKFCIFKAGKILASKKALEMGIAALVLATFLVLIFASISLQKKIAKTHALGDIQYKLLNTYDSGETTLFYIDEAARYSAYNALNELADSGGMYVGGCGEYFGAKLLLNRTKDCTPDDVKGNFESYFASVLSRYLSLFDYDINTEYDIETVVKDEKTSITAKSEQKLKIPISGKEIVEMKKPTMYYPGEYFSSPVRKSDISGFSKDIIVNSDRKSTRLNSSHTDISRMPSSA